MKLAELIDRPVVISRTTFKFLLNVGMVEASARVMLRLSPKPKLVVEYDLPSDAYEASNEIRSEAIVTIELSQGQKITALVGDYFQIGGGKVSGVLIPVDQPLTVLNEPQVISRCKFTVINLTSVWGSQDIHSAKDGKNFITQHFNIEAFPWLIEVTGVDSVMGLHYKMELEGGSAITHYGSIKRIDGQDFDSSQLAHLLKALHLFLSFARGSYCGLAFVSGQDAAGRRVWEQWGTYKTEPWQRSLPTWLPHSQSENLSPVFQGFWTRYNDANWGESLAKVVNWYLRSNESDEAEVGIILTQAALERLSYETVGARLRRGQPGRKDDEKEGEWIARALKHIGVSSKVPPACGQLEQFRRSNGLKHGPHAVVEIRDDLIHHKMDYGILSSDIYREARELGLWYVEMLLLKLFDYHGEYSNRLTQKRRGQVELVPWAQTSTGAP